ncbi:MAG: response regulator [Oligoflexales bacterium]|nr:response regulator [Oligoflexales bacterium]
MIKKVLVVDDSKIMLLKIQNILEKAGHPVITAMTGMDGIELARQNPDINLIITDLGMPGISGMEMCEKIREIPEHKNTAILVCTTDTSSDMKDRAKRVGVKWWIVKPINDVNFGKAIDLIHQTIG